MGHSTIKEKDPRFGESQSTGKSLKEFENLPSHLLKRQHRSFRILLGLITIFILAGGFFFGVWSPKQKADHSKAIAQPVSASLIALKQFTFNQSTLFNEWKEHTFKGKTSYQVETDSTGEKILHASSEGTSSVIYQESNVKSEEAPVLSWEWKVVKFPTHKDNKEFAAKQDNDFGARVYVVFRGKIPFASDVIQYVWDDHFPEGSHASSPFAKNVKIFAVHNGAQAAGDGWVSEKRDLVKDYEMLFGKKPQGDVIVIGFMSDSDNTHTSSEAYFRRVLLEKQEGTGEVKIDFKLKSPKSNGFFSRSVQTIADQIADLQRRLQSLRL